MSKYKQGYYTPKNPEKYIGDLNKIVYRSSWELEFHKFLDNNSKVVAWGSECIVIPYLYAIDGKIHRYYPDYFVQYQNRAGQTITEIIEVKPLSQTRPPRKTSKHLLHEQATYVKNVCKWKYAQTWCQERGWTFRVITEKSLFK